MKTSISKFQSTSGQKWLMVLGAAIILVTGSAQAQQAQTMEDRLRAQLRITTTQLQQVQNELAILKGGAGNATPGVGAAPTAPGGDVDKLKKELARSQAAERQARDAGEKNRSAIEKSNTQIAQYKNAYDELMKLARAADAERQQLSKGAAAHKAAVAQCEEKNTRLYSVSQEILRAYETMDMATLVSARQPFADKSRVKLEQIAQEFGDKLYEGKFDPRALNLPSSAGNSGAGIQGAN